MANNNSLPAILVIFGATGDLMQKKLASSLFSLYSKGLLPSLFQVVGFAKQELTNEQFRQFVGDILSKKGFGAQDEREKFLQFFMYRQGLFEEENGYKNLSELLGMKDGEWKVCSNKLFYIAASPQHYKTLFQNLAHSGLTKPCSPEEGWTRIIVEKPFGKDLETAEELDKMLGKLFKEEQIYRIDHYLGKETVQNILAFRFSNSFLQDSWNAKGIESIQIKIFEQEGIGSRGVFYDGLGALRDVGQNHLLQLLALFTMENPRRYDGNAVRKERTKILQSLKIKSMARGQYEGYLQEQNVVADSTTETYFRLEVSLETSNWNSVPIILESGKAMPEKITEVKVVFRHSIPCLCPPDKSKHYKNVLSYRIEPNEGIFLTLWVKKPGPTMTIEEREFSFDYRKAFEKEEFADAYERLLLNCIQGDQTLFVSTEEIMAEWKFVDPVIRAWQEQKVPLDIYQKGSLSV